MFATAATSLARLAAIVAAIVGGVCAGAGVGARPAAADAGEVARGREIAQTHCSRCHVVGDYNPFGGVSSTPSFQLIVNRLADWEERFSTFYVRRPHPAIVRVNGAQPPEDQPLMVHPIDFDLDDIDALLAFVATLRQ